MTKFKSVRWKRLVLVCFIFGAAWIAYASQKTDPLVVKLEEVSRYLYGKDDAWDMGRSGKSKVKGLFSPKENSQEIPTVPVRSNPAYDRATLLVKELKHMIEDESVKRAKLDLNSEAFQVLVEVSARYVDIQRALYMNFLSNVHEIGISPKAFALDDFNLRVDASVGGQLLIMSELQKKYHIRHSQDDPELNSVDLFIPHYDRMLIEISALAKLNNKVEYQKLIHLMYLRDSLVNRWSMRRIGAMGDSEGWVTPPSIYASFSEDQVSKPSQFKFSQDLGVEDRYQVRISDLKEDLEKVLGDHPLASAADYRKMVRHFYNSFDELRGISVDAESVVANLYRVEEAELDHAARQIILESNYPQDDLSPAAIARRTALIAFKVRKAAILTALIKRIKIDLATWRGYLEPDENGMVEESAVDAAAEYIKLTPADVARAERAVDPYFTVIAEPWKNAMAADIAAYYAHALAGGEAQAAKARMSEFFGRVLDGSADGVFAVKQVNAFNAAKRKLEQVPESVVKNLNWKSIPISTQCQGSGMGYSVCSYWINSNRYLSRLDARSDLGMAWVTPWTPGQVASLFSKKLEIIEKYDSETWAKLKPLVENESQMTWIAKFFEELNKKHQDAADQKRKELAAQAQKISKKLAKELAANPMLDIKKTDKYREIAKIQEKIQNVGFTPDQSVLDEGMYQAAALKVFGEYIDHTSVHVQIERPAPAPKKPSPSDDLRIKTYVAERDATYVKPPVIPTQSQMDQVYMDRGNRVAELGKLFSLLGFGEELFSKLRANPKLAGCGSFQFSTIESLYPKPDSGIRAKLNSAVKETARINKVSALSEISRTAQSQKLLAEIVMADVYSRTPFLRIQESDNDQAATGLERLEKAYSQNSGWNRESAKSIFVSLLKTAALNDVGKVEEGIRANPTLPVQDENFKKIFRAQAHNRNVLKNALSRSKLSWVESWDEDLKKETRTTSEKWSDRMNQIAGWLFLCTMVFLLFEFLPVLIPVLGGVMPTASAFLAGFSFYGVSVGSMLAGFLSGSNLLVQMFFMATIAAQGQVAFFTLPAQLQYQKEIANSTVGLTANSTRIVAPAERVSRENIQVLQDEIRSAKIVTGIMGAIQVAFIPLQVKQLARGFGHSGKVALTRFGAASPELAESMRSYSLSELVGKYGYAKGSKMYVERYTSALLSNKPVSAVNGGAALTQAQELLANSLSTHLSSSTELAGMLEGRIAFLKEKIGTLQAQGKQYFGVTQGKKVKDIDEALRMFFGKELSTLGFHLQHPQVKILIRERVAQALEKGLFTEIEHGTEKYLLKAFLLRTKAEKLMYETAFLERQLAQLRNLEAAAGGTTGTREVFQEFTRLDQVETLDGLLKWSANQPSYQNSQLGGLINDARRASKDFKIIENDIKRLTPREQAIYEAMNGDGDVIVNDDFTLQLAPHSEGSAGSSDGFLIVPGLSMGLRP